MSAALLVNIDVPDLARGIEFFTQAFDLSVGRRIGESAVELLGFPVPLYLLEESAETEGAGSDPRRYSRHWTPVHLDVVCEDLEVTLRKALAAGATQEGDIRVEKWGKIVVLADPFGHGHCLVQFLGRGYDELVSD